MLIIGKLLWYKKYKTPQDMLIFENIKLRGGYSNFLLQWGCGQAPARIGRGVAENDRVISECFHLGLVCFAVSLICQRSAE